MESSPGSINSLSGVSALWVSGDTNRTLANRAFDDSGMCLPVHTSFSLASGATSA